jgi:hypothetical protein
MVELTDHENERKPSVITGHLAEWSGWSGALHIESDLEDTERYRAASFSYRKASLPITNPTNPTIEQIAQYLQYLFSFFRGRVSGRLGRLGRNSVAKDCSNMRHAARAMVAPNRTT